MRQDTFVLDTPGFTSFSIDHIPPNDLQLYYREFQPYIGDCYYADCIHITEHDCAVKEQLGITVDIDRYNRYKFFVTGERDTA